VPRVFPYPILEVSYSRGFKWHDMSSITPSNIAGAFAQTVQQQRQSAQAQDTQHNDAARSLLAQRQKAAENMESIEDSYETTDDHVAVDADARGNTGGGEQNPQRRHKNQEETPHVDIQA
jgi:hypothetical protein